MAFVTKEKVSFPSEAGSECPGVMSGNVGGCTQGLVVIQEWWGMNDQIQNEALEIAQKGNLVTVTPDLYRGEVADDREHAGHLMGGLDWPGAVKDIQAAAKFLLSKGCTKVGVTGFCMGGALSFAAAVLVPEISAAAPFYGIPGSDLCDLTKIKIPLQCHFAEKDEVAGFSDPPTFNALREKLTEAGVSFQWFTYPTGHGFTNPKNPSYTKEMCDQALGRMMEFMNKNLA